MTRVEKLNTHINGKVTTSIKSRYCKRCDAVLKWECKCPNNRIAAWQRRDIFHSGKRYKGKKAWEKVHNTDYKGEQNEKF